MISEVGRGEDRQAGVPAKRVDPELKKNFSLTIIITPCIPPRVLQLACGWG